MRQRELRGRPSFSTACKRERPSKCASMTGACSTESTRSGKNSCSTARRVARLLVVGHQLTSPTILRRVRDREVAVGLEHDAKALRSIFERNRVGLQQHPQHHGKAVGPRW